MANKATQSEPTEALNYKQIKELLELVHRLGLGEVELQSGEFRLRISGGRPAAVASTSADESAAAAAETLRAAGAPIPVAAPATQAEDTSRYTKVTAPMIGTFYRSPAPDSPSFVELGDQVDENTVLCIIEAMKLMNEIKAETRGVVRKILVENGQPVEYGQPIFLIEPL